MKRFVLILIVLFLAIRGVFAFDMNEEREQFQFTFFEGIDDLYENTAMGLIFYPDKRYCLMYIRDYAVEGEEATQILGYGGFKYDLINDPHYIYVTLIDDESDVIEMELEITSEYQLVGYIKISGGLPERIILQDRYYLIAKDQIDDIVYSIKSSKD